jgi:hypothetical protein
MTSTSPEIPETNSEHKKHEKDPLEPANWEDFERRLEEIGIPEDPHERSVFIGKMITSGDDIEKFGVLLHEVLVPGVDSVENSGRGGVMDLEGRVRAELATPEERRGIFSAAANAISKLSEERSADLTGNSDQAYLDRVANILGMTIVLAHYFKDGNGRLARTAAYLVSAGRVNTGWDELLGGAPGAALRYMTSGKEAQRKGARNPNRIDDFGDAFSPLGFIPENNMTAIETIHSAAGIGIPLKDMKKYLGQFSRGDSSMLYGLD